MKTKNTPKLAYAILNAISLSADGDGDWCQIMPAGRVKARDGRPEKPEEGWLINHAAVERMVPGATVVTVRTTEPALVTLYRATGNSTGWQRFVRRNGIVDPLFIPGGHSVEVISEQQG